MAMPNGSAGCIWPECCWLHLWRAEVNDDPAHTVKWRLALTSPEQRYGCGAKHKGVCAWKDFLRTHRQAGSLVQTSIHAPPRCWLTAILSPVHRLRCIPSHSLTPEYILSMTEASTSSWTKTPNHFPFFFLPRRIFLKFLDIEDWAHSFSAIWHERLWWAQVLPKGNAFPTDDALKGIPKGTVQKRVCKGRASPDHEKHCTLGLFISVLLCNTHNDLVKPYFPFKSSI